MVFRFLIVSTLGFLLFCMTWHLHGGRERLPCWFKVWYLKGIFPVRIFCWRASYFLNRLFYRYVGHIEFNRFKEYYGMPRGHLVRYLRALFVQKENFTVYFSGKGDHYYIQVGHNDLLFFHYHRFLGKLTEKLTRKARVNTERLYRIVLMPSGHSIIRLKSN